MRDFFTTKKIIRGEQKMRKILAVACMTAMLTIGGAAAAFANHNTAAGNTGGQSTDPTLNTYNANVGVENWGDRGKNPVDGAYRQDIPAGSYSGNCAKCHGLNKNGSNSGYKTRQRGPHGGYTTQTKNCQTCHTVHVAKPYGQLLLPGETVTAVCNYCHDLTQTAQGPYNMLGVTSVDTAKNKVAAHRVVGLKVYTGASAAWGDWRNLTPYKSIPGGDNTTGGPADLRATAGGVNNAQGRLSGTFFTCDSCHTPHGIAGATVKSYLGDSHVKNGITQLYATSGDPSSFLANAEGLDYNLTNRLLKKTPNGVAYAVYDEYSAGWCAACHEGRDNDHVGVLNHPVDESAKGYTYINKASFIAGSGFANLNDWLASATTDLKGNATTIQKMIDAGNPVTLRALVGTDARIYDGTWTKASTFYSGRYSGGTFNPTSSWTGAILKGDVRDQSPYALTDSDALTIDPGTNAAEERAAGNWQPITAFRGVGPSCQQCHASARDVEELFNEHDNPANMTFPHVSKNQDLLVETADDFCTNCHGLDNLP